jgi:type I restriction enzyme S subunit
LLIEATTNQACAAILLPDASLVRRRFLQLFLLSRYDANRTLAQGGVQPNLSLGMIRKLQIPVPLVADQDLMVNRLDEKLSVFGAIERTADQAIARASALRRSLFRQAFRGLSSRQLRNGDLN